MFLMMLVWAFYVLFRIPPTLGFFPEDTALLLILTVLAPAAFWPDMQLLRIVRRVRAIPHYAACPSCTYDLSSHQGARCPECGYACTRERAQEIWALELDQMRRNLIFYRWAFRKPAGHQAPPSIPPKTNRQ